MTGLERNSDIVFASCYAPLLQVSHSSIQVVRVIIPELSFNFGSS